MIRVLLVDDQTLLRAGIRMLLELEPDISVVGEADDGAAGVRLAADLRPDVVLMDIRMPGVDGLEATARIAADPDLSGTHVVILHVRPRRVCFRGDPRWSSWLPGEEQRA